MEFTQLQKDLAAKKASIGIVGLGYVGLPLATLFASKFRVIGFDVNEQRIKELQEGFDRTNEVTDKKLLKQPNIAYTTDEKSLTDCRLIIVTVPTPIDQFKKPDLTPLIKASESIGRNLKEGSVVVYESTVYPGITEGICRETIEKHSKLKHGVDFFLGYSPERVNPGDKNHTIDKITKVVSGSTPPVADMLAEVYGSVITAGVHRAPTIATAEAAKVIENTQRDINIALINELSQIFEKMGLDTQDVLAAARTKWNFLDFRPGLVGGHCIGVDPYYLTYLAESLNIHPQVILAGRRINDNMGRFMAEKTLRLMLHKGDNQRDFNVGILGVTFKENVPDLRNTKVIDVAETLESFGVKVHLVDPVADPEEFEVEYHRSLKIWDDVPVCDALIVAVKHDLIIDEFPLERLVTKMRPERGIVIDVKGILNREKAKAFNVEVWRP